MIKSNDPTSGGRRPDANADSANAVPTHHLPAQSDSDRAYKEPSSVRAAGQTEEAITSFSSHSHDYLWASIVFGEQKAAFVFAADSAFLGYLFSLGVLEPLFSTNKWSVQAFFGLSSVLLLLLSVAAAVAAVLPRLGGNPAGLLFFGNIASRSTETYVRDVVCSNPSDLVRAILEHCHELATIARSKHINVRLSTWFGMPGFVSGMAYAVLANRHAHFV